MNEAIDRMLTARTFAVVGASNNPEKYGNIVYHDLKRHGKIVFAVNPNATEIDGDPVYPHLAALPEVPEVVVTVVPPSVTEQIIPEIVAAGIGNVWMQIGSESEAAVARAESAGLTVVHSGPCVMVGLRTHKMKK